MWKENAKEFLLCKLIFGQYPTTPEKEKKKEKENGNSPFSPCASDGQTPAHIKIMICYERGAFGIYF